MMKKNTKNWSLIEQSQFLKCLGELLDRGYSVAEAVQSSTYYMPSKRAEDIIACYGSLKGGDSFFDNLLRLNFDQQVISFVFFAEKHGGFSSAFRDASKMIQNKYEAISKMKKLLSYPLFLMIFTFILLFFVQNILIPRFHSIFSSMNLESTIFLKVVQAFHYALPILFFGITLILTLTILFYYLRFQKLAVMKRINILVGIPVIGRYVMQYYSYIFTLQLSYLLASGFSMYESLLFFQENKQQRLYAEVGSTIIFQLRKGVKLEKAVETVEFLDKELSRIIQHGQENGKLDQELYYYGSYCLKQMEDNLNKTMKMVQPALYTCIGILIISIYLAVLLPMFQLLNGL